jgi:Domain of unknown function DUF1828
MKEDLCRAFCDEISVTEIPAGLAVSTPFRRSDGDAISLFVVRDTAQPGIAHLEDDGETMAYLEACGVDFDTQTRRKALEALLAEHGVEYDESENVVWTPDTKEQDLPRAALGFVALLLRLFDFLLLTPERVVSTFREDAARRIKQTVADRAVIRESVAVSDRLTEVVPDLVVTAPNRVPVAIFLSQSAARFTKRSSSRWRRSTRRRSRFPWSCFWKRKARWPAACTDARATVFQRSRLGKAIRPRRSEESNARSSARKGQFIELCAGARLTP